jgi:peroxiredoxin Q/BCP
MSDKQESMPKPGAKAPAFTLKDGQGNTVKLADFKGKALVLYFYPKDDTPGCTVEAKEFRDALPEFSARDAVVLGVSPDVSASHCKFTAKYELNFPLLSDIDHAVAEKYGVWVEKNMYGRTYMGIQRATFLIGRSGKIAHVWPKVSPKGHAAEVLAALDAL